jgi:two-component system, LytTR family, sensor histidine kinase LytS
LIKKLWNILTKEYELDFFWPGDIMGINVILEMLSDLLFFAMVAYLTGRSWFVMNCARHSTHLLSWFSMTLLFSSLSIIGSYDAIPWGNYITSTRLASIIVGGIMGGPIVGVSVGGISGVHLALLHGGNATHLAIVSVLIGMYAGFMKSKNSIHKMDWILGAGVAIGAEFVQYGATLLFAKSTGAEMLANGFNTLATALVSVMGVVLFLVIINLIAVEQDIYGAKAAQLSLAIASRTLPYLRQGLTAESAQITARTIYELTKVDAVSITDKEHIIALIGESAKHYKTGDPIVEQVIKQAIEGEKILTSTSPAEDTPEKYPLYSHVVAPLFVNGIVVGAIKLTRIGTDAISEIDMRIADGLANLLSVQIQLADSDKQRKMREKAELRALRAQINPHFLFNTMSIIMSFCRTDPDRARNLLGHLVTMMRRSFANHDDFIVLGDELAAIKAYLEIAKSRFGDRLKIDMNIEEGILHIPVPVLSLQPLVENAVQHGLFPKPDNCILKISAYMDTDKLTIIVSDNGIGIPSEKLDEIHAAQSEGVGIQNVHNRLLSIYGANYGLQISSTLDIGTRVTICIPYQMDGRRMAGGIV